MLLGPRARRTSARATELRLGWRPGPARGTGSSRSTGWGRRSQPRRAELPPSSPRSPPQRCRSSQPRRLQPAGGARRRTRWGWGRGPGEAGGPTRVPVVPHPAERTPAAPPHPPPSLRLLPRPRGPAGGGEPRRPRTWTPSIRQRSSPDTPRLLTCWHRRAAGERGLSAAGCERASSPERPSRSLGARSRRPGARRPPPAARRCCCCRPRGARPA